jgi:hypothetical protein
MKEESRRIPTGIDRTSSLQLTPKSVRRLEWRSRACWCRRHQGITKRLSQESQEKKTTETWRHGRLLTRSRRRAFDNISVEHLARSIKCQEVHLTECRHVGNAAPSRRECFRFYSFERLQQALDRIS